MRPNIFPEVHLNATAPCFLFVSNLVEKSEMLHSLENKGPRFSQMQKRKSLRHKILLTFNSGRKI